MELKEFVSATLIQIAEGVKSAQEDVERLGATVNPSGLSFDPKQLKGGMWDSDHNITRLVEFDVAVTATESTATKGGVGVLVATIGLGTQAQSTEEATAVSRIKFVVPILLPAKRAEKRR